MPPLRMATVSTITCAGCTDLNACNYCYDATLDDGTCDYESCLGCWDSYACNFDDFKDYYSLELPGRWEL